MLAFLAGPGSSGDDRRRRPGRRRAGAVTAPPAPAPAAGRRCALRAAGRASASSSTPTREELDPGVWFGGSPARVLRLTAAGRAAWRELRRGRRRATARRRRLAAGSPTPAWRTRAARPTRRRPTSPSSSRSATGRRARPLPGRARRRARRSSSSTTAPPTRPRIAASPPRTARASCAATSNGGPAAARNTGLARVDHRARRLPRQRLRPARRLARPRSPPTSPTRSSPRSRRASSASPRTRWAGRYTARGGSLDLGDGRPGSRPARAVSYVPTAALVARRAALLDVARRRRRVRPGAAVRRGRRPGLAAARGRAGGSATTRRSRSHHEPDGWRGLLAPPLPLRHLGRAAGARHPGASRRWSSTRGPRLTVARAARPSTGARGRRVRRCRCARTRRGRCAAAGDPGRRACVRAIAVATRQTWLGVGRYADPVRAPRPLAAAALPAGAAGAAGARPRVPAARRPADRLVAAPAPRSTRVRFVAGQLADELAYGAGVSPAAVRHRTLAPLVRRRPAPRTDPAGPTGPTEE